VTSFIEIGDFAKEGTVRPPWSEQGRQRKCDHRWDSTNSSSRGRSEHDPDNRGVHILDTLPTPVLRKHTDGCCLRLLESRTSVPLECRSPLSTPRAKVFGTKPRCLKKRMKKANFRRSGIYPRVEQDFVRAIPFVEKRRPRGLSFRAV